MKKRLDHLLVERAILSSRTKAQDLIKAGHVYIVSDGKKSPAKNSSQLVDEEVQVVIESSDLQKFVSRGGLKLEAALEKLKISVEGLQVLDVGISTGGFTDCLLQMGAAKVTGIDVGQNQLDSKLQNHPQVLLLEKINAREMHLNPELLKAMPPGGWTFVVIDVSFISLTLILPAVSQILSNQGQILALVKPQFEVGAENLGRGGLVRDSSLYAGVEKKIREKCLELDLSVRDYLDSSIEGKDGNREFFIYVQKNKLST